MGKLGVQSFFQLLNWKNLTIKKCPSYIQWCIQSLFGQIDTYIKSTKAPLWLTMVSKIAHSNALKMLLLSHCFSLLSAFLSSKSFRNNKMHYEIIGHYFHVFFIEIQLKKQNLKIIIWAPEFRRSNQYTSLPNDLDTSLALPQYYKRYIITIILIEKVNLNFFTLLMSSQISRES